MIRKRLEVCLPSQQCAPFQRLKEVYRQLDRSSPQRPALLTELKSMVCGADNTDHTVCCKAKIRFLMRKRDQELYGCDSLTDEDTYRYFVVDFSKIGEKEHFFIPLKRIFQLNCKWDRGLDLDSALSILRLYPHTLSA